MQKHVLPDSLREGLAVVFVGTAPGHRSAAERAYYAHPGNRFWRTLAMLGLTPKEFEAARYRALLSLGVGFTDVCKTQQGSDHAISAYDPRGLSRKIALPARIVAFTKESRQCLVRVFHEELEYGEQPRR
jgi:TDG/mug DNA glycosylase family protein